MPGPAFLALAIQATATIDAVMAEPFVLTPMMRAADKTANDVMDTSRAAATTINATFLDRLAPTSMPNSYDARQARRPGLESGTPRLWVSPNEVAVQTAANPTFDVRARDQLLRVSDGRRWAVSSVFPTAGGALRCEINLLG